MRNVSQLLTKVSFLAVMGTAVVLGSSCTIDPVHDAAVKALGDEDPAIPQGKYHRAGQPCLTCHGGQGPADTRLAIAGTVYLGADDAKEKSGQGADKALVRIKDANGATKCFVTNCKGNFIVRPEDFPRLTFPLLTSIQKVSGGVDQQRTMNSRIGREGSCAYCHKPPFNIGNKRQLFDIDSPGLVRLFDTEDQIPAAFTSKDPCPPDGEPDGPIVCPEDGR
jgi:hypothetical protein